MQEPRSPAHRCFLADTTIITEAWKSRNPRHNSPRLPEIWVPAYATPVPNPVLARLPQELSLHAACAIAHWQTRPLAAMTSTPDARQKTKVPLLSFFYDRTRVGQTKKGLQYTKEATEIMEEVRDRMDPATRQAFDERLEKSVPVASRM